MFDEICKKIISPPKFRYSMYDLGATVTKYGKRTDFQIHNHKNLKMNCSLYQPHQVQFERACVIYLHSMNGSRLQGSVYVQGILNEGVSYCTFDFSGCGNSDGEKISFGANEKHDIEVIISKLKETFYLNRFILWGRSMGSASAIKYSQLVYDKSRTVLSYQNDEIVALVLDSSFKSFSKLLVEIGHSQSQIPKFIIQAGFLMIKSTLEKNGQFKISDLDLVSDSESCSQDEKYPLEKLQNLNLPILFLASKEDKTVSYQHSVDMFDAYKSKFKQLKFFKGLHNQSRQDDYVFEVVSFIRKILKNQRKFESFVQEKCITQLSSKEISQSGTISTPFSSQKQIKGKNSILKLIEQKSSNEESQTLFEFQNIQNTCVCTMFDNELAKNEDSEPYRKRERNLNYQEAKSLQSSRQENINCDQAFPKTYENQLKTKKSISEFSSGFNPKIAEDRGEFFFKATPTNSFFVQPKTSPKSFKKIGQSIDLKFMKMEESVNWGQKKGEYQIFEDLYAPLRVSSERSLRFKQSLKGH